VKVSVVWATAAIQDVVEVEVLPGATIADALARSGLVPRYALDPAMLGFAVFGRRAWSHTALADGDRVELTRPLEVDPKEARLARARSKPLRRLRAPIKAPRPT
jgi:putative ubiquitin-RnfH superfamily antitoxin RatB of RatAB toxin-antitoxin module